MTTEITEKDLEPTTVLDKTNGGTRAWGRQQSARQEHRQ
jgi:hypothetical protein